MRRRDEPYFKFAIDIELNESLDNVVDAVYASYSQLKLNSSRGEATNKSLIRVILFNLVYAAQNHPELEIGYSRRVGSYIASDPSNVNGVSKKIIEMIDALTDQGYISHVCKGFYDRKNRRNSFEARMLPGPKIIELIHTPGFTYSEPKPPKVERPYSEIVQRDENKYDIEPPRTPEVDRMRANVQYIADKVSKYDVELLLDDDEQATLEWKVKDEFPKFRHLDFEELPLFDLSRNKLYRVFNRSSIEYGGRFYGTWIQDIYSRVYKFRKHLLLDGEATVELDFNCLHPYMCYQSTGKPIPDGDIYEIPIKDYKKHRPVIKEALNAIINATGVSPEEARRNAVSSIVDKQFGHYGHTEGRELLNEIVDKLVEKHKPIEELFFSGTGLKLQRLDSDIAERVMLDLLSRDIPVIPVHDSFITQKKYADELRQAMKDAYRTVMGLEPPGIG